MAEIWEEYYDSKSSNEAKRQLQENSRTSEIDLVHLNHLEAKVVSEKKNEKKKGERAPSVS